MRALRPISSKRETPAQEVLIPKLLHKWEKEKT